MALVEYLVARDGLPSRRGLAYDYVLAGDGLYVVTENRYLAVRIPVASALVRGLSPIYPFSELKTGPLPQAIWDHFVWVAQAWAERDHEVMCIVTYEEAGGYHLFVPRQATSPTRIIYRPVARTVLEIHSHHRFAARFSPTDDADEQHLCIYGVVGRLDQERPEVALRVGAYGCFLPVPWKAVFAGERGVFRDVFSDPTEEGHDDLPD
jgi:PRTRC genetic system protein A